MAAKFLSKNSCFTTLKIRLSLVKNPFWSFLPQPWYIFCKNNEKVSPLLGHFGDHAFSCISGVNNPPLFPFQTQLSPACLSAIYGQSLAILPLFYAAPSSWIEVPGVGWLIEQSIKFQLPNSYVLLLWKTK